MYAQVLYEHIAFADVTGFDVAAFDLDDDAFCFARIVVNKNLDAVDAARRSH